MNLPPLEPVEPVDVYGPEDLDLSKTEEEGEE